MADAIEPSLLKGLSFLEIMSIVISFRIKHRLRAGDTILGPMCSLKAHGSTKQVPYIDLYVNGSYWKDKIDQETTLEVTDLENYHYAGRLITCKPWPAALTPASRPNLLFNVLPKSFLIANHELFQAVNGNSVLSDAQKELLMTELAAIAGKHIVNNPAYSYMALRMDNYFRRSPLEERRLLVEDVSDMFKAIATAQNDLRYLKQLLVAMAVFIRRHKTAGVYRWNNDPLARDVADLIKFIELLLPSQPRATPHKHLPAPQMVVAWFIVRTINKDPNNWNRLSLRYQIFAGPILALIMAIIVKVVKDKASIEKEIAGVIERVGDFSSLSHFTIKNAGV